ncbi:hypothetical protein [Hymenobacter jeollabukensis]|uniref:Uncharacterized protein n=1 Tax=Hymenobacter jeollabukensis TaxID=2025313 RepID=A0A5R8WQ49_9BACT|nr:hypothetical protein [Hymenobacter jeollabukensis]TLM91893.1 hypothetical protein FDY95_15185 [Hymenobacter jeollabukensis]
MPYEQDFEFRPMNDRRPEDEPRYRQPRSRHDEDHRRQSDDRRRPEPRPGSRYAHDNQQRGDRYDDYDRSQPRGDYGRDPGSFSYGRRSEYNDPYDTDSFSTSRERQNPSAFHGGLGPGQYEGDYRGGRGYYSDEDARWRRGHEVDRPESRRRFQDPYDDRGPARERPSGYGRPGEQVRPINDRYGHDGYDGSSQGGRYREDDRRYDDYPGRDRAHDGHDGRYHYDDEQNDRRNRRR